MNITTITVSYGVTQSLPEYSNVKPALTLSAELEPGDDPDEVEALLWRQARAAVHAQVDDALEACDRPARYDPAPRYQLLKSRRSEDSFSRRPTIEPPCVVILPDSLGERIDGYVHAIYPEARRLRYAYARRKAEELAAEEGRLLIDCSDGDLSKIPPVP